MNGEVGFLFDLDGVLIDSERRYTEIWHRIDQMYPTGVKDFPRVIKGSTLYDILNKYFPKHLHEAVKNYCIAEEQKLTFNYMPGARKLLEYLKRRDVPTALVTSSDAAKMETLRQKLPDIYQWFTAVVYGEMVKRGKPAPDPYLLGAEKIGVPPRHCAVVEDSLSGILSGRAAGCYVVGMTETMGRATIEKDSDMVLDTLEGMDVQGLIDKLKAR